MHDEPDTRRIALVLDVNPPGPHTDLDRTARGWLCNLVEQLADHDIIAIPVRIDIDGCPYLIH